MFRIIAAIVLLTASAAQAGNPIKIRDFASTWVITGTFGTVDAQCSMQCRIKVRRNGVVKQEGNCEFTMADEFGGPVPTRETVKIMHGKINVAGKHGARYAVFSGSVATETLDFSFGRIMLVHESKANRQAHDLENIGAGTIVFSNGAVGSGVFIKSSRGSNPNKRN